MAYTTTTWKEHNQMTTTAKVNGLNNAETQYDEAVTYHNAHTHDGSHYTKTEADAKYYDATNDGSGSGLVADLFDGYTYEEVIQGIPTGVIAFWTGTEASIPSGWYRCNGSNDTPNLTDRMIIGYGPSHSIGSVGGSSSSTKSVSISNTTSTGTALTHAQLPAHQHTVTAYKRAGASGGVAGGVGTESTMTTTSSGGSATEHTHALTSFSVTSFNPLPAMYAGYWIMKGS
jgi:hypothetical protein